MAPYGENWRELRKIAVLELLSDKRVQGFEVIRDKEVNSMVDSIAYSINPINLRKKNSSDGKDKRKSKFHEILNETQHLLGGFCVADFFPWMGWLNKFNGIGSMVEKNFKELDKYYDQMIEEHLDTNRPKLEHEDFVDVLLRLQKDPTQEIALGNEHIKGVLTWRHVHCRHRYFLSHTSMDNE
ncbi:unnamed protein product [Camellia sinensis]